jgi:hypothetical protein
MLHGGVIAQEGRAFRERTQHCIFKPRKGSMSETGDDVKEQLRRSVDPALSCSNIGWGFSVVNKATRAKSPIPELGFYDSILAARRYRRTKFDSISQHQRHRGHRQRCSVDVNTRKSSYASTATTHQQSKSTAPLPCGNGTAANANKQTISMRYTPSHPLHTNI